MFFHLEWALILFLCAALFVKLDVEKVAAIYLEATK